MCRPGSGLRRTRDVAESCGDKSRASRPPEPAKVWGSRSATAKRQGAGWARQASDAAGIGQPRRGDPSSSLEHGQRSCWLGRFDCVRGAVVLDTALPVIRGTAADAGWPQRHGSDRDPETVEERASREPRLARVRRTTRGVTRDTAGPGVRTGPAGPPDNMTESSRPVRRP